LYLQRQGTRPFLLQRFCSSELSSEFARTSLRNCIRKHGQLCSSSQHGANTTSPVPIYLIDVKNDCLVSSSTHANYAALSYVWGSTGHHVNASECSKENLARMQSHGFFNLYSEQLPKTVANAMTFTRLIGYRYLWVGRYCIAQDDQVEKHSQLRNMGLIYDCAQFVVIAAEGDGREGLCLRTGAVNNYRRTTSYLSADLGIVFESPAANTRWATRG
jgi:hypothetical protein